MSLLLETDTEKGQIMEQYKLVKCGGKSQLIDLEWIFAK